MNLPEPPKSRLYCDVCGYLPTEQHKSLICRLFLWIDKFFK